MSDTETMRAVIARGYGGPEVLEVIEVPVPRPGSGQVLIKVQAATVNPVDLVTRSGALAAGGLMTPRATTGIGWDVAGTIAETGPGVRAFAVGDSVIGIQDLLDRELGCYADYVVLDATAVAASDLPPVEAATLPLNGLTARQALDLLRLSPDDTLLIIGAAGAVGGFAVQFAVGLGLRVAVVAAAADEPRLRSWGATWFIDRDTPDPATEVRALIPGGVDGAVDTAGLGVRALAAVRTRGAFATVVGGSAPIPLRGIRVHEQWISADGPALAALARNRPALRVAATLPLERAREAHERLEAGGLRGRLVLVP
ncbi:NADP-dependent oxidoreductase [Nocardia aurantia]|nr:NADP-dependent oxidoreductase [Nocardia aurantia]